MKFSVSSADLLKQLQIASGAIGSNPVLPILEDFLFTIDGNTLKIAATDLETSISTEMEIQASGSGEVAIPAKILLDTLKALPEQPITFSVDEDNFAISIKSAYGKYKLAGEDGADFPTIPQPDEVSSVELPSSSLMNAIGKTLFATSNDDLRPAMTGVYFSVGNAELTCVATDAHKLVKYTYLELESSITENFIVPKKALNLLKNSLHANDEVNLSFNRANAFFSFGSVNLVCRLIDARYPDYNAVIPTENPNVLTINRKDFQASLKRIAIYANKTTNQVVLNISAGSLTVSAQDLDFSNEATEQLPCSYEGEPLSIGFNAKFLAEMLNILDTDDVKLEMSNSNRAGILLPSDQPDGEDIMMLVMPVMLGN
ncbi:MAG: DNA polymerase III subunit beta [Saprospiraceae bacterium]